MSAQVAVSRSKALDHRESLTLGGDIFGLRPVVAMRDGGVVKIRPVLPKPFVPQLLIAEVARILGA